MDFRCACFDKLSMRIIFSAMTIMPVRSFLMLSLSKHARRICKPSAEQ